ncbi:MAG: pyridoxamine 5'-phosphate oxidase family protein, partial [Balneolaceae bacterium]|nr:pyridoxamine 5'-phosphate oxidase family protein [Balneolaceae bacterium]
MNLQELREHYTKGGLDDEAMPENPIPFFELWLREALEAEVVEPNAMALATVDSNGHPDVRIVLLKGLSGREIVFYT